MLGEFTLSVEQLASIVARLHVFSAAVVALTRIERNSGFSLKPKLVAEPVVHGGISRCTAK